MKKAVMYGAGNIGRGFIGKVFSDSGYDVCFLDIMPNIIEELNRRHEYPVRIVTNNGNHDEIVKNVRAVHAGGSEALAEIASFDIMATAVGVNVLPKIAPVIAKGIIERMKAGRPLDIILCENQLEADILMRGWINEYLNEEQREWAGKNIGLVEAPSCLTRCFRRERRNLRHSTRTSLNLPLSATVRIMFTAPRA
jgi:mannitol-1-phosphate 5-dehydrogenase